MLLNMTLSRHFIIYFCFSACIPLFFWNSFKKSSSALSPQSSIVSLIPLRCCWHLWQHRSALKQSGNGTLPLSRKKKEGLTHLSLAYRTEEKRQLAGVIETHAQVGLGSCWLSLWRSLPQRSSPLFHSS